MTPDANDIIEKEIQRAQPRASVLGVDSLMEDIFGLNIRALKSIAVLCWRPARYFDAARDRDWFGRYTPSFRIWLGIFAIVVALRFFYTSEDSPLFDFVLNDMVRDFVDDPAMTIDAANADALTKRFINWGLAALPISLAASHALIAVGFRWFGQTTSYLLRLRFVFAVAIPSTLYSAAILIGEIILGDRAWAVLEPAADLSLLIDFLVIYFGPVALLAPSARRSIRFCRAFVLTLLLQVGVVLGVSASLIVAIAALFVPI